MQRKVGTLLDDKILEEAKTYSITHHIPLNRLLEGALEEYLQKGRRRSRELSTVEGSFGVFKVPAKILEEILEEDIYETE